MRVDNLTIGLIVGGGKREIRRQRVGTLGRVGPTATF